MCTQVRNNSGVNVQSDINSGVNVQSDINRGVYPGVVGRRVYPGVVGRRVYPGGISLRYLPGCYMSFLGTSLLYHPGYTTVPASPAPPTSGSAA